MAYSSVAYNKMRSFIDNYGTAVAKAIANTGLYFPAVIGQSAYESGYGERIPKDSNNFGGIKYNPSLEGVVGYVDSVTTEYVGGVPQTVIQKFSKFRDAETGFKAHIQVLLKDRYKDARLNSKTPQEQILGFAKAGYTTTPANQYAESIYPLIEASIDYAKSSGRYPIGRVEKSDIAEKSISFPILAVGLLMLSVSAWAYYRYRNKL